MSSWAKPGIKCVCIDASLGGSRPDLLVVGAIYTVRRVVLEDGRKSNLYRDETVGVVLVEQPNPYAPPHGAFAAARFRPVIELSDDVSLFTHHLDLAGEMA